jgi:hypothetical protein
MTTSSFSFGTPLSSIPNTSYKNVSEGISYGGGGSSMIDPGTATLVSAGISAIGSGVGGAASGKGAQSAADKAREAAAEQAKSVKEANRETLLGTFGLESLAQKQDVLFGGPLAIANEFDNRRFASAMDAGPGAYQRGLVTMGQNLAARQAETDLFRRTGVAPMSRYS